MQNSRLGIILSMLYAFAAVYLIATQGLFGESFISLILGLPWSMIPAFFEYGVDSEFLIYILLFAPMVLNLFIIYWIGSKIERIFSR